MYIAKSHSFPGFIVLVLRVSSAWAGLLCYPCFRTRKPRPRDRGPHGFCVGLWWYQRQTWDLVGVWSTVLSPPPTSVNSMMCLLCLYIHIWLFISGEWEKRTGVGLRMGWNWRAIINSFSHTNHWNTTYEKQHHQQNAMITQHRFIFGSKEGVVLINRWRRNVYNILLLVMELSSPS